MDEIACTSDQLVEALLDISRGEPAAILDSCGDSYLDSHTLIAGISPLRTLKVTGGTPASVLATLDQETARGNAVFFTLSYGFGPGLLGIEPRRNTATQEPDMYASIHDALIVHNYRSGLTHIVGDSQARRRLRKRLAEATAGERRHRHELSEISAQELRLFSNFKKAEYLDAVEAVRERIRSGDTYQTNLTHQLTFDLTESNLTPQNIFRQLRRDSPAAFAAFLTRPGSSVISGSPERFFKITGNSISASPIKGTRPRSDDTVEDERYRADLLHSRKDAAENVMIVDLVRNDLGRICEYGSIAVQKLCGLERHRTLYHLVSTITGELRPDITISDVLTALFPCGSITGAPKISTMRIIDQLEPHARALSMGAIGYAVPAGFIGAERVVDTSVAIRTAVIRDGIGEFSVGGGIVIDSIAEKEFAETLTKAEALRSALNGKFEF